MALNHARHVIPNNTMSTLVQALVLSVIRYCLSVYGTCNNTQIHRIQKIINFGARVVSGKKRHEHVSAVVQKLGWLNAKQLVEYHAVCMVRSVVMASQPEDMFSTIGRPTSQVHSHATRHVNHLSLPRIRTEAGRRRLCYRGVKMLNMSKVHVSDRHFRTTLKSELLSRSSAGE